MSSDNSKEYKIPHRLYGSWTPPATLFGGDDDSKKPIVKDVESYTSGGTGHLVCYLFLYFFLYISPL